MDLVFTIHNYIIYFMVGAGIISHFCLWLVCEIPMVGQNDWSDLHND